MVIKYLSAFFLPGMFVVLFSRVTLNRVIGLLLMVALITASVYKGYTNHLSLIIVDAFSLTAGFWYADRMLGNYRKKAEQ
jgi:general stress protein CsbA